MNTDEEWGRITETTEKIIGAAMRVSNVLGCGFLEKVYENALVIELRGRGLCVEQQCGLEVRYEREVVGQYVADLVVESEVIVELKAVAAIDRVHRAQCMNCLRASGRRLCLLLNFGTPRLEIARIAF